MVRIHSGLPSFSGTHSEVLVQFSTCDFLPVFARQDANSVSRSINPLRPNLRPRKRLPQIEPKYGLVARIELEASDTSDAREILIDREKNGSMIRGNGGNESVDGGQ